MLQPPVCADHADVSPDSKPSAKIRLFKLFQCWSRVRRASGGLVGTPAPAWSSLHKAWQEAQARASARWKVRQ